MTTNAYTDHLHTWITTNRPDPVPVSALVREILRGVRAGEFGPVTEGAVAASVVNKWLSRDERFIRTYVASSYSTGGRKESHWTTKEVSDRRLSEAEEWADRLEAIKARVQVHVFYNHTCVTLDGKSIADWKIRIESGAWNYVEDRPMWIEVMPESEAHEQAKAFAKHYVRLLSKR